MALGTVIVTALGCLMLMDNNNVASSAGLSAIAILLLILNVAFLALVAFLVLKQGKRHIGTFLRQAQVIVKAAFQLLKAPCTRKAQQPCLQLIRPQADVTMPVRTTRSGSMQPMLSERMLSEPNSSLSSFSQDDR